MYVRFIQHISALRNWFKQRPIALLVLLLASGLLLRALPYKNTIIGFDQVQILESAEKITSGDFTLIGPRTGPAQMFTGPLIYYWSVPFLLLFGDLATVVLVPLTISLITGIAIYVLISKYVGQDEALLSTTIWAFSPFLIGLDRIFWNPNLMVLAAALLYFPLLDSKKSRYSALLLAIGSFISYQAHFSGFLLIGLAIGTIIFTTRSFKLVLAVLFGLLMSLLPTMLFDLRNNFLNVQGALALVSSRDSVAVKTLPEQLLNTVRIPAELIGSLFFKGSSYELLMAIGIIAIGLGVLFAQHDRQIRIPLSWIAITIIVFSLYRGEKPEYYFLLLIPAFLHLLWFLLPKIGATALKVFLFILIVSSVGLVMNQYQPRGGMSITALQKIHLYLQQQPVKQIVYDVALKDEFGVKYYFKKYPLTENGSIVHIAYPNDATFAGVVAFQNVGVWIDPRSESSAYVTTDTYILGTSPTISLLTNPSAQKTEKVDEYLVLEENQVRGTISISPTGNEKNPHYLLCQKQALATPNIWSNVTESQFIWSSPRHCLIFISTMLTPESAGISIQ